MTTGRTAHQRDAVGIDVQVGRTMLHESNRGDHIVNGLRIARLPRLGKPIVDAVERDAPLAEIRPPGPIRTAAAGLPPTSVDGHDHWMLARPLRAIEVAAQHNAVVCRVRQVAADGGFPRRRLAKRDSGSREQDDSYCWQHDSNAPHRFSFIHGGRLFKVS